jgi:flagellin
MTVINSNTAALMSHQALTKNERAMNQAMSRLSTGLRINTAKDDAAGLAVTQKMTAQVRALDQAVRNANDGISMVQTAEAQGRNIANMLQRMRELAVQAASDTYSDDDRELLDVEFDQLAAEITASSEDMKWNNMAIVDADSGDFVIQVGAYEDQQVTASINDWTGVAGAAGDVFSANYAASGIATQATADTTLGLLDTAITEAATELANYGAYMSRLEYSADVAANTSMNLAQSRSRIEDADYAKETSALARTQIIAQAGTAMLAQANQVKQTVLALLQ